MKKIFIIILCFLFISCSSLRLYAAPDGTIVNDENSTAAEEEDDTNWGNIKSVFFSRLGSVIGSIPLIGQVLTIWYYIYNGDLIDVPDYIDPDTQSRLISLTNNLDGYNEVFKNPEEVSLNVPIPFGDGETAPFSIPLHYYGDELVDLRFLGVEIKSFRDVVFFFMNISLWWNFWKKFTRFAFSLFTSDPLGDFLPSVSTDTISTFDEVGNIKSARTTITSKDKLHKSTDRRIYDWYSSGKKGGDKQ